ncbi:MAG TPA: 1-(5-phosphoribosyl)-5-[(5-phosphoribosylamino)methylideneamino]imidazole-4-carboxamide isomerase [Solirubrobacteraceae bacterium]|nr:1-(5-phosphoribosyl)-5-[(5-phosphoribosylamino)methylideneamino]imidazole-4-carboxamide isomerase [Solirubrobacteraceae bacterium]
MRLYPAIDILGGSAVRLTRGSFEEKKVYDSDPLSAARGWVEQGARYLHVVDLDGARAGTPQNLGCLREIAAEFQTPVQYGGGLRSAQAVAEALSAGARRLILGTAAFADPDLLSGALGEHGPERVLVSVDVRGGRVATAGWTETTELEAAEVIARLHAQGVRELVYTNVDRDGMLEGPDLDEVARVADAAQGRLIYSGGIGSLADLEGLAGLPDGSRVDGVIVGKALYERRFTVTQALEILDG